MENWKDINGYEGLYQVSDMGRVKSQPKQWIGGKGAIRNHDGKILQSSFNGGYLQVVLQNNGIKKTIKIHRLVAEAFLPNLENKLEVNHIDTNKSNNKLDNLEWNTRNENMKHASINKCFGERRGEANNSNKVNVNQVIDIRFKYKTLNMSQKDIAKEYGVSSMAIFRIVNNKTWQHVI
jgi:hypothetical protein